MSRREPWEKCHIHLWAIRAVKVTDGVGNHIYLGPSVAECLECRICQLATVNARLKTAGDSGATDAWAKMQNAVWEKHGR